jgi:hypothetical protein
MPANQISTDWKTNVIKNAITFQIMQTKNIINFQETNITDHNHSAHKKYANNTRQQIMHSVIPKFTICSNHNPR